MLGRAREWGNAPKISVQPFTSAESELHFQPDLDMHVVLAPADATSSRASFMVSDDGAISEDRGA